MLNFVYINRHTTKTIRVKAKIQNNPYSLLDFARVRKVALPFYPNFEYKLLALTI